MTATTRNTCARAPRARLATALAGGLLVFAAGAAQAQVATSCPAGLETSQVYAFTGAPVTFTVPANVNAVRAIAVGADGGNASTNGNTAGTGANISGTYAVTPGQVFTVLVGGAGASGDFDSGGGGASGVYLDGTLAIIAGAGGGDDNTGNGRGGLTTEAGGNGGNPATNTCTLGGLGGTGGNGGQFGEIEPPANCQTGQGGGGGGGFLSAGGSSAIQGAPRRGPTGGGRCAITGAAGGQGGAGEGDGGVSGGWGVCGGGGSDDRESGGGGGYSGGGGGPEAQYPGGGGSFLSPAATTRTLVAGTDGGGSARNGAVRLCYTTQADLRITKTNTPASGPNDLPGDTVAPGSTSVYSIVVTNLGGADANGAVVRDPPPTNLTCTTATCGSATGGAVCPAVTVAALQSTAGVTIATLPSGGALTFTLTCNVP